MPRRSISLLWQVFNDIADGFGITKDEMQEIFCDLAIELNISQISIKEKAVALFLILDTDRNGLIDALELFGAIAGISGMRLKEIFDFLLCCYDFDGIQELTIDEVTLALKSMSIGLSKIANLKIPNEETIEQLVSTMFVDISGKQSALAGVVSLRITEIIDGLLAHGDIWTWYVFFNNCPQCDLQQYDIRNTEVDYDCENQVIQLSTSEKLALEWNVRAKPPVVLPAGKEPEKGAKPGPKPASANPAASPEAVTPKVLDPWVSAATLLTPLDFAYAQMPRVAPGTAVEPQWVYGYQAEKSRNNVRYNSHGHVVYHVSRYAVVYNIESHEQTIFTGHYNEILCLAMHPDGNIVATGEMGAPDSKVLVWQCCNTNTNTNAKKNSNAMEILFTDTTFHRNGVIHVAFSLDGKLLGTVGNDKFHTLAVYQWADKTMLFTSRVGEGNCLCLSFMHDPASNNTTVCVGGDSYLCFWSKTAEGFAPRPGNFSMHSSKQPITCVTSVHVRGKKGDDSGGSDQVVTGTASGQLLLWVDRNCVKVVRAHEGTVSTIYASVHSILTGGKDQRIRQWTLKLEPGATFNISPFGRNPSVRSICMSTDGTTVLFGTRGADIYEISAIDGSDVRGGPIASGHSTGQLRSVTMHPSKYEFATCCDDCTVRVWDLTTHTMIKMASFDAPGRSLCYSPMGDVLVIGLGSAVGRASTKAGAYVVLNEEDLSIVHEARDSAKPISLVKFSPEGETLVVAADDGPIYLYAVQDEYELIGRCLRHTMPVLHIDFSADGEWIRTNSAAKDLCFFNTDDASLQSNLPAMRDVQWATHTCVYSWHVKGVHRTAYEGEQVTTLLTPTENSNYLVCGTSFGYVKLMPFPCAVDDAECHRAPAHMGPVVGVQTTFDQQKMITAGLVDRCVVFWKVNTQVEDPDVVLLEHPESDDYALEVRGGSDIEKDFMPDEADVPDCLLSERAYSASANPALDTWLGQVVAPTNPVPQHTSIPDTSLRLEHVYGYKCQNMRNNVRYGLNGDIVYVAATVGVVVAPKSKAQRFFQGHTEAISAYTTSADGSLVATGQLGVRPRVFVWSSESCQALVSLSELQMKSVTALAFSSARDNYALLAVVGLDDDHTISIYNWRLNYVISKAYGGCSHILGVCFSDDSKELTAVGVKYINMWNVSKRSMSNRRPVIGDIGRLQPFLCVVYFAGTTVVATSDGNLYTFVNYALKSIMKAHEGAVNAMNVSLDGTQLVTGGRDGACRVWNQALECVKEITVEGCITSCCPRVRSVAFSPDRSRLVIGTRGAEIFEATIRDATAVAPKPVVAGHGIRELWGLATHPTKEEFATCGDDCTIRIWDAKNRSVIRTLRMDAPARAITYSPDGKYLAVGFGSTKLKKTGGKVALSKEGSYVVLSVADNLKMVHEGKDSDEQIRVVKFSPDGKMFAVGSEDSRVCLYAVKEQFARKCTIAAHKAPIFSVDFNIESTYVQTVDATRRMCYSDCGTGVTIPTPAVLRDEKWSTWSSPIGWPTLGVWACQPAGAVPYVIQKSWSGLLLAVGNTGGKIQVVHNPCQDKAGFVANAGHAGPISQVAWVAGDGKLLTSGIKDHVVMQWKCIYDQTRESGNEGGLSCDDSQVDMDCGMEFHPRDIVRSNGDQGLNNAELWKSNISPPSVIAASVDANLRPSEQAALIAKESQRSNKDAFYEDGAVITKPPFNVVLNHVHGIKIADCRNTIRYNEQGHLVYMAGTYGIICDRNDECKQKIYQGHNHVLISIDVDSRGRLAATGELANDPELHIWDATSTQALSVFRGIHKRGIACVNFTPCGHYLVTLGQDLRNSVVVLHSPTGLWNDGYVSCSSGLTTQKMLWCLSLENSSNEFPFVVGGNRCIYFFRAGGKSIERCRGVVGKKRKLQPIMCAVKGHPIATMVAAGSASGASSTGTGTASKDSSKGTKKGTKKKSEEESSSDIIGGKNKSFSVDTASAGAVLAAPGGEGDELNTVTAPDYAPPCLLLTGTVTGHIYVWVSNRVHLSVVAHDGSVNSIITTRDGYVTGSKEGLVKIWNMQLKLVHTYNTLLNFMPRPLEFSVHALAINQTGSKLTVGMKSGEVFEVVLGTHSKVCILESHASRQLQALAANPLVPDEFVTGGDDGVVRVWSSVGRTCLRKNNSIEVAVRSACYSPDAHFIAVGIGGNPRTATKDGAFMVLEAESLEIVYEDRKAKKYISDLKFSPDGAFLAVGSQDGRLFFHDVRNAFNVVHSIEIPPKDTAVLRMDFSTDSKTLRLSTSSEELFYYSSESGTLILVPSNVRDCEWASYDCVYSWNTQGVWRAAYENVNVQATAVVESLAMKSTRVKSDVIPPSQTNISLAAAAYQNGDVRVFNYPCTSQFVSSVTFWCFQFSLC